MSIQKLDKLRAEIAATKEALSHVEGAALDDAQISARIDAWLDEQERRVENDIFGRAYDFCFPSTGRGLWPSIRDVFGDSRGDEVLLALAASLNREQMKTRLLQAAQAHAAKVGQVSDKPADLATLRAKLYKLERAEEELIVSMVAAGEQVCRRADADPLAILGLQPA